ncbi:thioesterase II family protein [Streptomyces sp. CO7]
MTTSPWFVTRPDAPRPAVRVYCFPHAGGNAKSFLRWQPDLAGDAEIVGVCQPGRGHRFRETPLESVADLADGAAEAIAGTGGPFLLFGHSFGAVLAFEVARRLGPSAGPRHLVASGCSAPALLPTRRVVETARLDGPAFTEAVGFFGGLPPEVVADEALQDLLLPHLRSDFRTVARYTYRPSAPLTAPVTLINGADDPHVDAAALEPWARESVHPPVAHQVPGGHFYFEDAPALVTDVLRPLVRAVDHGTAPRGEHVEVV